LYDPETPLESLCRPVEFSPDFDLCNLALRNLESEPQLGSTAKAVVSLEHICPTKSMAPVLAIVKMVAGLSWIRNKA
jgi:hypothetical protein